MSAQSDLDAVLGKRWRKPPLIRNKALRWRTQLGAGFVIYLILPFDDPVDWGRVYEGLGRDWVHPGLHRGHLSGRGYLGRADGKASR